MLEFRSAVVYIGPVTDEETCMHTEMWIHQHGDTRENKVIR
jgi:hypothetical protein